jgi:hypothetical protein
MFVATFKQETTCPVSTSDVRTQNITSVSLLMLESQCSVDNEYTTAVWKIIKSDNVSDPRLSLLLGDSHYTDKVHPFQY